MKAFGRSFLFVSMVIFTFLFAMVALAQVEVPLPPPEPTGIVHSVLQYLAGILITALIALVVQFLRSKGIELNQQQEDLLKQVVTDAIHYAEEMVTSGKATNKLETALGYIKSKIPSVTKQEAHQAIHAALPQENLGFNAVPGLTNEKT